MRPFHVFSKGATATLVVLFGFGLALTGTAAAPAGSQASFARV